MAKNIINSNLIKKIYTFLKNGNSLKFVDPTLFETIDKYKETIDIDFNNYFLELISDLPKLDFENTVKISREVYKLYGKEQEFDRILKKMINNYSIDKGSLNPNDDNCITKAHESRTLLSGTYYDVVLLCHEIGHKLRYDNSIKSSDIMYSILFETPSIILEFAASDYVRDNYGVDINAEELRKKHISSIKKDNNIENNIFLTIINLLKERKLNTINLYKELAKNPTIVEYLNKQNTSIVDCIDEGISNYYYDIGYILGTYTNNSDNKIELLNTFLKYKDKGINSPFTIDDEIIKYTLESKKNTK